MRTPRVSLVSLASASLLAGAMVVVTGTPAAAKKKAKPYPTVTCVASKQKAAAAYCQKALASWAAWEKSQDGAKRDASLGDAFATLEETWAEAEATSTAAGADCSDTTIATSALGAFLDSAIGALVDGVNAGLDLGDAKQAGCGQKILKAAGSTCAALLEAESKYLKNPAKKNAGAKRDGAQEKAAEKLENKVSGILEKNCPSEATANGVAGSVSALATRMIQDTTNSPQVDSARFETFTPSGPVDYLGRTYTSVCMEGSP